MSKHTAQRRSRESFTRTLERICRTLSEINVKQVASRSFIFLDKLDHATVRIDSIWVVGSYARGALQCGDLDLVVSMTAIDGAIPFPKAVAKSFFGVLPLVRYYQGTPEKNSSGVAFPDAVLVWEPGRDWQRSLNAITPDPLAGPTARETDEIPFRLEQLRSDPDDLIDLISLKKQGQYEWEFVPITKADLSALEPHQDLHEDERSMIRQAEVRMGSKSRQLIPPLIRFLRQRDPNWLHCAAPYTADRSVLHCGSTIFYFGTPPVDLHRFKQEPGVWQVALVPHLSARGPNGIWVIRRGTQHPDLLAMQGVNAYYLRQGDHPMTILSNGSDRYSAVRLRELATSYQAAQNLRNDFYDAEEGESMPEIAHVAGIDVLKLIYGMDVIDIFSDCGLAHALTYRGISYVNECDGTEDSISSIEDVALALRTR